MGKKRRGEARLSLLLLLIRYRPKRNPAVLAAVLIIAFSQLWSDSVRADGAEDSSFDAFVGEYHVVNVVSFSVWQTGRDIFPR